MSYYLGIDAGSAYIKLILIDDNKKTIARKMISRGADIDKSCKQSFEELLRENHLDSDQIRGITATGYGRKQVSFAGQSITEITALSIGGVALSPQSRIIIDIGGQDSKVIALDATGKVFDFVMNQKCAAGTGRFLEVTSASLGEKVENLGSLSQKADNQLKLTSTCTVFAESEIVSFVANGEKKENIIKALHTAIAGQIAGLYYQVNAIENDSILFVGGVALNGGMQLELSNQLDEKIQVPEFPQYVGAYGASLYSLKIL